MTRPTPTAGRMSRRVVTALAVLSLAGGGLTACTPGSDVSDGETSGCGDMADYGTFAEGTTVTVGTTFSPVEAARFDASVARFEECTGIDVVQDASDHLEASLRAATASANGTASADGTADPAAPEGAELPDLAVVPQTGLIEELVDSDLLHPMPDSVGANLELGWERSWLDVGTVDGTLYAAPLMASVKSFVWYSPTAFKKAGYKVPSSWDELVALTDEIAADHPDGEVTPWCLGISDGETTGWAATDWLEDAMLATQGTGAYDAWAGHTVPLNTGPAVEILDELDAMLLADGHVAGGRAGAAATTVEQAGEQLVSGQCLMLHASSTYETVLPVGTIVADAEGKGGVTVTATPSGPVAEGEAPAGDEAGDAGQEAGEAGEAGAEAPAEPAGGPAAEVPAEAAGDAAAEAPAEPAGDAVGAAGDVASPEATAAPGTVVSAFLLPSSEDRERAPLLVGGDYLVALEDSLVIETVMQFLTSAEWAQTRVELGGMATANRGVEVSDVSSDVAGRATELLQSRQTVIRMDASDSMPSSVGTDALWSALTQWTAGELSGKEALTQAEAAWPKN